jgi:hypothetical protein
VLNLKVPHHLQTLNRFGLPENIVVAELVAERLAALVLLEWDLVSGALVVSVVVSGALVVSVVVSGALVVSVVIFAVNVVVEFVVPVHCVALVAVPGPVDFSD